MRRILSTATAVSLALCAVSASAQVPPYPGASARRRSAPTAPRSTSAWAASGPGGRAASRLRRDRRHVGADGRGADARPYGYCARPARAWACRPTQPAASTRRTQAEDVAGVLDALKVDQADVVAHDIGNMVGFRLRRTTSRARDAAGADRRSGSRHRAVGGDPQEPAAVAFPLRRAGHGTARGRARTHLSRPLLERFLRRLPGISRRPRGSITPSSMRCPAPCIPASRSSPPSTRTRSTTATFLAARQAEDAGARASAARNLRPDDGGGDAMPAPKCDRRHRPRFRALDHGRESRRHDQAGPRLSSEALNGFDCPPSRRVK